MNKINLGKLMAKITGIILLGNPIVAIYLLSSYNFPLAKAFQTVNWEIIFSHNLFIYLLIGSYGASLGIYFLFFDTKFFKIENSKRDLINVLKITILITITISSFLIFTLDQLNIITIAVAVVGIIWKFSDNLFKTFNHRDNYD